MTFHRAAPHILASVLDTEWQRFEGPSVLRIAEGEALVRGCDELLRAGSGDLVCVPRGVICELRRIGRDARLERLEVEPGWVERALDLAAWDDRDAAAADAAGFHVDRGGTDRARRAARLMREIDQARVAADEGAPLRLAARCVELLGLTVRTPAATLAAGGAGRGLGRRARFLQAVDALRSGALDEISLPAFAKRAGLSVRHASRLFQLELGKSFREHLAELRLERAKALLRETEMSVIEVAGETGWSSLAHFNSVFRRRVGSTPSQFRTRQGLHEAVRIAS